MVPRLVLLSFGGHSNSFLNDIPRLLVDWGINGDFTMASSVLSQILDISLIKPFYRFFSNYVLLSPPSHATPADTAVEWAYAFDVHTNAFFPFYLTLYLAQLFLVPVVLKDNWVCIWAGNTLYLAGSVNILVCSSCTNMTSDLLNMCMVSIWALTVRSAHFQVRSKS